MQVFNANDDQNWNSSGFVSVFIPRNMRTQEAFERPEYGSKFCGIFCRFGRVFRSREYRNSNPRDGNMVFMQGMQKETFMMTNLEYQARFSTETLAEIDKVVAEQSETFSSAYAAFSSKKMGWINCDRFADRKGKDLTHVLCTEDSDRVSFQYLIFSDINSVMTAPGAEGRSRFLNIPLGEEVILISISFFDGSPQLGIHPFEINEDDVHVEYKAVSEHEIESAIEAALD